MTGPGAEVERCELCGHALSRHNELGYCTVYSKSRGDCPCDGTSSSRGMLSAVPPLARDRAIRPEATP